MTDTALPPLANDLRCAPQAVELQLDPRGTASRYTTLVLIEYPGLWPARIEDIDLLAAAPPLPPGHRILTTRASDSQTVPGMTVWRAGDRHRFTGTDYEVGPAAMAEALVALAEGGAPNEANGVMEVGPAPAEVLICGHGRRDTCCGSFGIRLLAEAEARAARGHWPGVRVRRCSHTGGHRFAPTGITLPDGRFWAFLDIDALDAIVTGRPDHPAAGRLGDHNRGLPTLDAVAQVAEAALFDRMGPGWRAVDPTVERLDGTGDPGRGPVAHRIRWSNEGADGQAIVTVRQSGSVTTPACGVPLDEATKSAPTFEVVSIEI